MMSHIIASSQPPPSAIAGDGRDDGRAEPRRSRSQDANESFRYTSMYAFVGHLLDVGAGRERPLGTGDHDRTDVGVRVELLCRRDDLAHERRS